MTRAPRSFLQRVRRKSLRLIAPYIPTSLYGRLIERNPVGFFYHLVSDRPLPHVAHLYPYKSTQAFEADIRFLKRHYTLIGYAELLAHARGEAALPPRAAFLSFDDGFAECYTVVRPILQKHRIPCIFFLATDWIDNQAMFYRGKISLIIEKFTRLPPAEQTALLTRIRSLLPSRLPVTQSPTPPSIFDLRSLQQSDDARIDQICEIAGVDPAAYLRQRRPFLTRAQIREMRAEGFVFGGHTRNHPKLNRISQERQAAEIVESCRIVAGITADEQVPFAFPFSGNGVDRDFLADLRAQNPHVGLIFDTQKLRRDRPFIFHRIWADKPVPGLPPSRNLAYWLKDAYVRELVG